MDDQDAQPHDDVWLPPPAPLESSPRAWRWSWKAAGLGLAGGAVLLGALVLGAKWLRDIDGPHDKIVVNQADHQLLVERLRNAGVEIDRLPVPTADVKQRAPAAIVEDCSQDSSGELYQPSLTRQWTLTGDARSTDFLKTTPEATRLAGDLVRSLESEGWVNDGFQQDGNAYGVHKDYAGYRVVGALSAFSDSLLLSVGTSPDTPCSLRTPSR